MTIHQIADEAVGHLMRETNIFPNQTEAAKAIIEAAIRKFLAESVKEMDVPQQK